jgi:hypothetical protein
MILEITAITSEPLACDALYHSLPFHALSASWWLSRVGPVALHVGHAPWKWSVSAAQTLLHDGLITLADEQSQRVAWRSKLGANHITVGS